MKKNKANYFATREKAQAIENAVKVLSANQMITISGGTEQFEEEFFEDGSDYKNYAESTSYNRKTTYAKIRAPR